VIDDLAPPDRKAEGEVLLRAFCHSFNESFHLVQFLYECNPNPFITEDNQVDLSGGRKGGEDVCMNEQSTINFSLPTSFHGETEAAGLCTIRLLTTLQVLKFFFRSLPSLSFINPNSKCMQDCHNTILGVLHQLDEPSHAREEDGSTIDLTRTEVPVLRPGMTPALRAQVEAQAPLPATPVTEERTAPEAALTVPVTSHRTPRAIVMQRIINYDR
jgi:hypothetical protein